MFESRYYQDEAEYSIFEYFESKEGNPIVAMPTGTGKSVVIAKFLKKAFSRWPSMRVMMLTHVKELIEQNGKKLLSVWPTAPMGVYSAGLNERSNALPIVFGGIQSVAPAIIRGVDFGYRDLVIIDECHLLSQKDTGQYQVALTELKRINPQLKVIGFSATPYRLKQGLLTEGGFFTDICYDITGYEAFNKLIAEGYMSPLISKRTSMKIDFSGVDIVGGEFNSKQVEEILDDDKVIYDAVKETVEYGYDRRAWLAFTSGTESAENIAQAFSSFGISACAVHSKIKSGENTKRLNDFKAGKYQALVSMNKLTTGFDHPPIDLIADYQPTTSTAKHVQKNGRGTRPSPDTYKTNCLSLDFAGNTKRLGPINDPALPGKPGKGGGDAPIRICTCGCYNAAAARFCVNCGQEFKFETKLYQTAGTDEILRGDMAVVESFRVSKVFYAIHRKESMPPSMKVSYACGSKMFSEWVCFEHGGLPGRRARDWWSQRCEYSPPPSTEEAVRYAPNLRRPARIRVHVNKKYPEILSCEY